MTEGLRPSNLEDAIAFALAAHGLLDPWLVNTNYDQDYWRSEAHAVAPEVSKAASSEEVYASLSHAVRPMVRSPEDDPYVRDRLVAAADAVWRWLLARRSEDEVPNARSSTSQEENDGRS